MSQTTKLTTSNQLYTETDVQKIFIWNNRYDTLQLDYTNSTYDAVTIPAGTVVGQKTADGNLALLESGSSDGSQFPYGILAEDVVVDASSTFGSDVSVCVFGWVAENKIELQGSDTLATVISGKTLRARIKSDTEGIHLKTVTDLTESDNS